MTEAPITQSEARSGDEGPAAVTRPPSAPQSPGWLRPAGSAPLEDADRAGDEAPADGGDAVQVTLEIEDGDTTLFEAAVVAFHSGEFQRAESLFLEEAQRTVDSAPQRAAISYRQAALAARRTGNMDASDHWMRLAGREYLRVTEDDRTPLPFIREAAMMAAKCFLSVENLSIASKGLRRAQAIESVLRADDDLMAEGDGGQQGPAHRDVGLRIERRATVRPAAATGRADGDHRTAADTTRDGANGGAPLTVTEAASVRGGWLRRLRHPRPARHVA